MLSKNSTCVAKWDVWCTQQGDLWACRIFPGTASFNYRVDNFTYNERWYLKDNDLLNIAVLKEDFEAIQWPTWLSPGEHVIITVLQSGNYIIEDD